MYSKFISKKNNKVGKNSEDKVLNGVYFVCAPFYGENQVNLLFFQVILVLQ